MAERTMRGGPKSLVAMVAWLLVAAVPASAATLEVRSEDTWPPGWAEPYTIHHIVYDGEGFESNDVTVAPDAARTGVVLTDPGIAIRTPLTGPGLGPPAPQAAWTCTSPGTSVAACAALPGYQCWSLACSPVPGPITFEGRIKVAGNSGDDRITILPTSFRSTVWGVYGNDTIDVRNGQPDHVFCHDGHDSVTADAYDTVESACEVVRRP